MRCYLQNAEIVRTPHCSDRIHDQHCHTRYEILFVLKGSMRLNLEGQQLLLEEDTGILIEPLKYHVVTGNNAAYHRLIVFLNPDAIPEEIAEAFHASARTNFVFRTQPLSQLFHRFAQVLEKQDTSFEPLLGALLTQAVYALTFEHRVTPVPAESKRTERLRQIIAFVDGNLDRELGLEEIAAHMYMSQSSLCHLFRQEMKISLKQYILHKKIMYAKSLLYQGLTPGEAAAECGYKNYASFYKIFLKITGKTPAQITPAG